MLKKFKFPLYVITHPASGFYDMKHEKEGSMKVTIINLILFWVVYSINRQYAGFVVNKVYPLTLNSLVDLTGILLMYFLWCVGNWSITTLMEGEGKFKEIAMATSYSLTPLILAFPLATIIGNYVARNEEAFYYMVIWIAVVWFIFLLFMGIMSIHNYTVSKTFATIFLTFVAILLIIFLSLLIILLLQQVYMFIYSIYTELIFRA